MNERSLKSRHRLSKRPRIVVLAMLSVAAAACSSTTPRRNDWSHYTGPGAEYLQREEYEFPYVTDPLESVNRSIWSANDVLWFRLIEPISAGWRWLVPQPIRTGLVHAVHNSTYPVRAVSHLLQAEWTAAGHETKRFAINTTVGLLGLVDRAAAWGLPPADQDEDMGRTFVEWGWKDSTYVMLPAVGPSTVRDASGWAADLFLDPATYYFPAGLITRFITQSEIVSDAKRFVRTSYDAYGFERYGWEFNRWSDGVRLLDAPGDGPAVQTLRSERFRLRDPWFAPRADVRSVALASTGHPLPYNVWLQPRAAAIVFILPGFGVHRDSERACALAEMVYREGFSAVTISSAMNFEFMETASTAWTPGLGPLDARDCHVALHAIFHDLQQRFPGRMRARVLLGHSLGAFHAMYIAAAANRTGEGLIDFDRYLLLDTPVSLRYAAQTLDDFYNVPLSFPEAQRDAHVYAILHRATTAFAPRPIARGSQEGPAATTAGLSVAAARPEGDSESERTDLNNLASVDLPFSEAEAQFLVGLRFRLALHDVIWSSQSRHNIGVLATPLDRRRRAAASAEILTFSFLEYFYALLRPSYERQRGEFASEDEMFALSDARSLTNDLPRHGRVRIFVNANDPLLTDSDRQWLTSTFGPDHVTIRESGGHSGNLHDPAVQNEMISSLRELVVSGPLR